MRMAGIIAVPPLANARQQPPESGRGNLEIPRQHGLLWPSFQPNETNVELLTSRTLKEYISVILSPLVCGHLL